MIVDDTPANLQVLEQILHREGYEVMSFPSGEMALRALKKGKPDLILLDIMMPGISGYDVCRALKADSESASIPVMFLSAMSETEDKIRAFKEGGVDYITKPFHAEEVIARVGTHIRMHRMSLTLQQYNEHLQLIIDAQVQEIRDSHLATLSVISSLAESRDGVTGRHTERTGLLCRELTLCLQQRGVYADEINDMYVTDIYHAAPLHDIGKIAISDTILLKPGKLTQEEFETMKDAYRHRCEDTAVGTGEVPEQHLHQSRGGYRRVSPREVGRDGDIRRVSRGQLSRCAAGSWLLSMCMML